MVSLLKETKWAPRGFGVRARMIMAIHSCSSVVGSGSLLHAIIRVTMPVAPGNYGFRLDRRRAVLGGPGPGRMDHWPGTTPSSPGSTAQWAHYRRPLDPIPASGPNRVSGPQAGRGTGCVLTLAMPVVPASGPDWAEGAVDPSTQHMSYSWHAQAEGPRNQIGCRPGSTCSRPAATCTSGPL